ncbi:hypothetical protein ONS95_007409 [Cadophora gregata]|uniref:uncharacterized protein n=1 Tax=Cadophora gregata TaxID=51156 RepID=UPI0026DAB9FF|nr:uncharacterized protein ONS95_007409 [Cadophora gregata]KAK0118518.1 hypothetical protein ONS96_011615 [Cadophora gregata f. sp. sojae]KAK0125776.1 hypothetical protein ONS95_007409 [Cadophora gregata]
MSPKAAQYYIQSLKDLSIGDPIYHPDSEGLKVGHCGYFDENGRWKDILDLMNIESQHSNYKPLSSPLPVASSSKPQRWGPIFGNTVTSCGLEQTTSIVIPGAPASAGVNLAFEKSSNYGAVLMADPVTFESFPHKEQFHQWCKANAPILLADKIFGPVLKRRPLFIVTELYSTPRCSITYWEGATKQVSIGVSADAWSAGKLTGSGFWGKSTNVGTWRGFGFDDSEDENKNKEKNILFVGGLEYKFNFIRALLGSENPLDLVRRGPGDPSDSFGICSEGDFYSGQVTPKSLALPFAIPQPFKMTSI